MGSSGTDEPIDISPDEHEHEHFLFEVARRLAAIDALLREVAAADSTRAWLDPRFCPRPRNLGERDRRDRAAVPGDEGDADAGRSLRWFGSECRIPGVRPDEGVHDGEAAPGVVPGGVEGPIHESPE